MHEPRSTSRKSQERRILMLLHAAWPNWAPATAIAEISLQYSARIHSLRRKGWAIANRIEIQPDGTRHGFFRFGGEPARSSPQPDAGAESEPASLFGDLPESSPDAFAECSSQERLRQRKRQSQGDARG